MDDFVAAFKGPYGHGGAALYHDEGSGGFTDTDNVIDGPWDVWAGVRAFGWRCPGSDGQEVTCGITVTENWVRTRTTPSSTLILILTLHHTVHHTL